jgi:hypothetical protein
MWMETMETGIAAFEADSADAVDALSSELARLGCGFRNCGFLGLIFVPRSTGGFNFERGLLHYWDLGVNVYLDWDRAYERLSSLPSNAGQEKVCVSLLEIESD